MKEKKFIIREMDVYVPYYGCEKVQYMIYKHAKLLWVIPYMRLECIFAEKDKELAFATLDYLNDYHDKRKDKRRDR